MRRSHVRMEVAALPLKPTIRTSCCLLFAVATENERAERRRPDYLLTPELRTLLIQNRIFLFCYVYFIVGFGAKPTNAFTLQLAAAVETVCWNIGNELHRTFIR